MARLQRLLQQHGLDLRDILRPWSEMASRDVRRLHLKFATLWWPLATSESCSHRGLKASLEETRGADGVGMVHLCSAVPCTLPESDKPTVHISSSCVVSNSAHLNMPDLAKLAPAERVRSGSRVCCLWACRGGGKAARRLCGCCGQKRLRHPKPGQAPGKAEALAWAQRA